MKTIFLNLEGGDRKGEILLVYEALTGIIAFTCFLLIGNIL